MKEKIKVILISLIITFFIFTTNVSAAAKITGREKVLINGNEVYKVYDNPHENLQGYVRDAGAIIHVEIDGKTYVGYCVEFGINSAEGDLDSTVNLYEFFRNALSEEETQNLIKKISLYIKYGYGSEGKTDSKYYLVTQQLIWETINATGFYSSEFYQERSGRTINAQNIGWTQNKETKEKIDLSTEYAQVKNDIVKYYTTPSFCSSQNKLEIEVGETIEYTDSNNVLSLYDVTCDSGITCEKNNNKLTVTAKDQTGSQSITFTKPKSGTDGVIYRPSGKQGVIVEAGSLEPVTCQFGIDTFKNVQTSETKTVYIVIIGLFCLAMTYIMLYTNKTLNKFN